MNAPSKTIFKQVSCWILAVVSIIAISCSKDHGGVTPPVLDPFVKGADVSWLTQMEANGYKFYNSAGTETECMKLLQSLGINTIRLRAWVHPGGPYNSTKDVVLKAQRAKALGMKLVIDLHYSDTWADPGSQAKPAAWSSLDFEDLKTALANYTSEVLDTLVAVGATPEFIQIGNETNDGALWEDGRASTNMANFAALVLTGYNAAKAASPTTQVIVHLSNGWDNDLYRWMFDGLKANGAKWDIIGMSVYPYYATAGVSGYSTTDDQVIANITDMVSRYSTPCMIVEVGMPVSDPSTTKAFLTDIITKCRAVPNGQALGVLYWEPEGFKAFSNYDMAAFDDTGKPTSAMDAFK